MYAILMLKSISISKCTMRKGIKLTSTYIQPISISFHLKEKLQAISLCRSEEGPLNASIERSRLQKAFLVFTFTKPGQYWEGGNNSLITYQLDGERQSNAPGRWRQSWRWIHSWPPPELGRGSRERVKCAKWYLVQSCAWNFPKCNRRGTNYRIPVERSTKDWMHFSSHPCKIKGDRFIKKKLHSLQVLWRLHESLVQASMNPSIFCHLLKKQANSIN